LLGGQLKRRQFVILLLDARIAFASLAALLMSANPAAQQEQQQQPQRECSAVVMTNTGSVRLIELVPG
jgi:hypothetical protein